MAKTGVAIKIADSALGSPPQVNANSMLFVYGAAVGDSSASMPFALGTAYMIRSINDLDTLGITTDNNPDLYEQVRQFFSPVSGINNTGTILWIVGFASDGDDAKADVLTTDVVPLVLQTVAGGFEYRPRNLMFSLPTTLAVLPTATKIQACVDALYAEKIGTVALMGFSGGAISTWVSYANTITAPQVGVVAFSANATATRADVGAVGGWMSTLSVGTSIGDASLPRFGTSLFMMDDVKTPCNTLSSTMTDQLGEYGYIYPRKREPKNGLWLNDGATGNDPANALSTLEAGRTLASMVDDLRAYFTPYINNRIPVNSAGDIEGTYKQVVLDGARVKCVSPYIANGDISDARINLVALNNDMVGTRTWEVTLAILPAPTLRWIDGYVFYVKSL